LNLSWPEFGALTDRWDRKQRRENYRAGLAPAAVMNLFLPKRKRLGPMDFFEPRKELRQTPDEMLFIVAAFNAGIGGLDLRKHEEGPR
jgi:hypothetical protein